MYSSSAQFSWTVPIRRRAQSKKDILVDSVDTMAMAIVFEPCWTYVVTGLVPSLGATTGSETTRYINSG